MQLYESRRGTLSLAVLGALVALGLAALLGSASPKAQAAEEGATSSSARSGGLAMPRSPSITDAYCVKDCVSTRRATPGAVVRIVGKDLAQVKRVILPGKKKRMRVKPRAVSPNAVRAIVPRGADDGRPFVVARGGLKSNRAPRELKIVPKAAIPREVFPVRGPYNYGSGGAAFGAGRPGYAHQGQDVMAACGTRLVSIRRAEVLYNKYQSAAGYYVVLRNLGTNTEFAYMHLMRRSPLKVGQRVGAGQPIGRVGDTGRAYGCHLHFEYWVGSWQTGGRPIDPLPYLRSLQR